MNYIFFGAGKIGKTFVQLWQEYEYKPIYFIDNNSMLWGDTCEDIVIYSPEKICSEKESYQVILTSKESDILYNQLVSYNIPKENIVKHNEMWKILPNMWNLRKKYNLVKKENRQKTDVVNVLFDLQNGLVLGGVEAWVFQTSQLLRSWNIVAEYLILDTIPHVVLEEKRHSIELKFSKESEINNRINLVAERIWEREPCMVVCNFTGYIFWGMCYAKHMRPERIHLIAVLHNDEENYYCAYTCMEKYIDYCLVLSCRMKNALLEKGFPKEKIRYLSWSIPCEKTFLHNYSLKNEKLHIGYAGRVTVSQKRMDLLEKMIEKLVDRKIEFVFELAGTGDYLDEFLTLVKNKDISDKVCVHGFIPRKHIADFWKRQDIMVSCSEWEGHSISQCEAMAAGAVPIITDVSGARDDVTDGENGFIVEVDAVDQIVEKICFIYEHRELLPIMGEKAYETIKEKNSEANIVKFWKDILFR